MVFQDRAEAGRVLASRLLHFKGRGDVVVLALPRGGVPVGFEVARELGAPLDVFIVRKLGTPGQPELAMGAIASGVLVLNEDVVAMLGIPEEVIESVAARERQEIERREREYRGERPAFEVENRTVILVDDGLATGSSMRAGARALREKHPAWLAVAVPVAARATCEDLKQEVDEVVCAVTPESFAAVGQWYREFPQTTDEEVRELLQRAGEQQVRAA